MKAAAGHKPRHIRSLDKGCKQILTQFVWVVARGWGGIVGCKQHRLNKVLGEDFFSVVPNTSVSLVNAFLSHVFFFFFLFAICSSTSLSPVRMKLPSTYALSLISGRAFSTGHNRAIVGGPLSSVNALVLLIWGVCWKQAQLHAKLKCWLIELVWP